MTDPGEKSCNHKDQPKPFFSRDVADHDAPHCENGLEPGAEIGPYKILSTLGEGGFGIVYLAEQRRPIKRRVALKVIKPGMDSKEVLARFEAERQTLAILDHPNIAHIYGAGVTEMGRPYFAMEYVKGVPITEHCDHHKLNIEERLRLFLEVCKGIQHAHQKGIIHRDIKPSNILVSVQDEERLPKIIDFGVAKAITQNLTNLTLYTQAGRIIGTPEYMSPEQAQMNMEGIDIRTDIYSLGAVLYELITGVLPFDTELLLRRGIDAMRRVICEEEPKTPSTRLTSLGEEAQKIASLRQTDPSSLSRRLHRELEWIPLKAMRKEPTYRYRSASEFADDIQNYLNGRPLIAGPESISYKLAKFVRRHRTVVVSAIVIATLLIVGFVVSSGLYVVARKALKTAEERAESLRRANYGNHISLAYSAYRDGITRRVDAFLASCPEDLRGWEWDWLSYISDESEMTLKISKGSPTYGQPGNIFSVRVSPDGERIYAGGIGNARAWNVYDKSITFFEHGAWVFSVDLDPDGKRFVTGGRDNTIKIWDAELGYELKTLRGHTDIVLGVAFSPDGKKIVSGSDDKTVKLWDAATGDALMTLEGHAAVIRSVAYSPNGKHIASGSNDKTVKLWDAITGDELKTLRGHVGGIASVVFSPDGTRLVSGSDDQTIRIWDILSGGELKMLQGHSTVVREVAYSPDGRRIASASQLKIKVWDALSGMELTTLHGHTAWVNAVIFSPDGERIISGSWDATVKIWNPDINREYVLLRGHTGALRSVAFSPDGRRIVTGSDDRFVKIWDTDCVCELKTLCGHSDIVLDLSYSPDGNSIVSAGADKLLKIWDSTTGKETRTLAGHTEIVRCVVYSPDGKRIVSGSDDKSIRIWDVESGTTLQTLHGHTEAVLSLAFNPKGDRIVSGGRDGYAKIWNSVSGEELGSILASDTTVAGVAFMPDNQHIVTASGYGRKRGKDAKIWNVDTMKEVLTLKTLSNVSSVEVLPGGKRILTGTHEPRLWDAIGGTETLQLPLSAGFTSIDVSADGKKILIADSNIWDAMLFESSAPAGGYGPRVAAERARKRVDKMVDEHASYKAVIQKLEQDSELEESIRKYALQIARSRYSVEAFQASLESIGD